MNMAWTSEARSGRLQPCVQDLLTTLRLVRSLGEEGDFGTHGYFFKSRNCSGNRIWKRVRDLGRSSGWSIESKFGVGWRSAIVKV